jgi:hypothetical protein
MDYFEIIGGRMHKSNDSSSFDQRRKYFCTVAISLAFWSKF